ncbi:MAG: hypothetical protein HZB16_12020 [Armatimonadetes bacterium]|nr:hypothetical protein [Armatimonadota bacterium]
MIEPEELLDWCRDQDAEAQIDTETSIWLINGRGIALVDHGLPRRVGVDDLRAHLAGLDPRQTISITHDNGASFRDLTLTELSLAIAMGHLTPAPATDPTPRPSRIDATR